MLVGSSLEVLISLFLFLFFFLSPFFFYFSHSFLFLFFFGKDFMFYLDKCSDNIFFVIIAKWLSHAWLFCDSLDYSLPGSSVQGSSRQEHWNGLPFAPPGDLLNPEIKPEFPELAGRGFTTDPPGKPLMYSYCSANTCLVVLGLHWRARAFCSCRAWGLRSGYNVQASHGSGCFCGRAQVHAHGLQ